MVTREQLNERALKAIHSKRCILLQLATGTGKSKIAIDMVNDFANTIGKKPDVLLLVAKRVHKENWRAEFEKWGGIFANVTIECYESMHKYEGRSFDIILADEAHHLNSELRRNKLESICFWRFIGLSATFPLDLKVYFRELFAPEYICITCDLQDAIDSDILPEPKIITVRLELDNSKKNVEYIFGKSNKGTLVECDLKDRWKYLKDKHKVKCMVTQQECYNLTCQDVDYYKNTFFRSNQQRFKNMWLRKCSDRLKFLADVKTPFIKSLSLHFRNNRRLIFCASIEQTKEVSNNAIHSQNKDSEEILRLFNEGDINNISTCQILNEGVNLYNCQIGIFANLNASEIIQRQRMGRLLRHKNPYVIIPFYGNTREEELLNKMLSEYDKEMIYDVDIEEINNLKINKM